MVLLLDGNPEHLIYDCSRSNQIPQTDQITEIVAYVRT